MPSRIPAPKDYPDGLLRCSVFDSLYDTYRGVVKVKVGPIQAQFKGQASFLERNDVDHKAVLKGEGRDTGGKGNASALITAQLTSISATSTKINTIKQERMSVPTLFVGKVTGSIPVFSTKTD